MMSYIANTPEPPYYAVIFTSERTTTGDKGYAKMSDKMVELASGQPGFLGVESSRNEAGAGITVSYWRSLDAIEQWKNHALHKVAQERGKSVWYQRYHIRVCKVEKDHYFEM